MTVSSDTVDLIPQQSKIEKYQKHARMLDEFIFVFRHIDLISDRLRR